MIKNFIKINKKRGFTLIETLVAISILMITIAGPMSLVGNGIKASAYSRDQITAFYLAQDAIEAIRFIRDNNRIAIVKNGYAGWDSLANIKNSSCLTSCTIDTPNVYSGSGTLFSSSNTNTYLNIDSNGRYTYGTGTATKFKRTIKLDTSNTNEVSIVVTIDWSSGLISRQFSIREDLFNWN
jgi:prepilin-type N-terminal cleavage/methylation domain-containing protein